MSKTSTQLDEVKRLLAIASTNGLEYDTKSLKDVGGKGKKKGNDDEEFDAYFGDILLKFDGKELGRIDFIAKFNGIILKEASNYDKEGSNSKYFECMRTRVVPLSGCFLSKDTNSLPPIGEKENESLVLGCRLLFGGPFNKKKSDSVIVSHSMQDCSDIGMTLTLSESILSNRHLSNRNIIRWVYQILTTLNQLHSRYFLLQRRCVHPDFIIMSHDEDLILALKQARKKSRRNESYPITKQNLSSYAETKRAIREWYNVREQQRELRKMASIRSIDSPRDAWIDINVSFWNSRALDVISEIDSEYFLSAKNPAIPNASFNWDFTELSEFDKGGSGRIAIRVASDVEGERLSQRFHEWVIGVQLVMRSFALIIIRLICRRELSRNELLRFENLIVWDDLINEDEESSVSQSNKNTIDESKSSGSYGTSDKEKHSKSKLIDRSRGMNTSGINSMEDDKSMGSLSTANSFRSSRRSQNDDADSLSVFRDPWDPFLNANKDVVCQSDLDSIILGWHKAHPLLRRAVVLGLLPFVKPSGKKAVQMGEDLYWKFHRISKYRSLEEDMKKVVKKMDADVQFEQKLFWTEEDELERLKINQERKDDLNQKAMLERAFAKERIREDNRKIDFELLGEDKKNRILRQKKARAKAEDNMASRKKLLHMAQFHTWSDEELKKWMLDSLFTAYRKAKALQKTYGYGIKNINSQGVEKNAKNNNAKSSLKIEYKPAPTVKSSQEYLDYYWMIDILKCFPGPLNIKILNFFGCDCLTNNPNYGLTEYLIDQDSTVRLVCKEIVEKVFENMDSYAFSNAIRTAKQEAYDKVNRGILGEMLSLHQKYVKAQSLEIDNYIKSFKGLREIIVHLGSDVMHYDSNWVRGFQKVICTAVLAKYNNQQSIRTEGERIACSRIVSSLKMIRIQRIMKTIWRKAKAQLEEIEKHEREEERKKLKSQELDSSTLKLDEIIQSRNKSMKIVEVEKETLPVLEELHEYRFEVVAMENRHDMEKAMMRKGLFAPNLVTQQPREFFPMENKNRSILAIDWDVDLKQSSFGVVDEYLACLSILVRPCAQKKASFAGSAHENLQRLLVSTGNQTDRPMSSKSENSMGLLCTLLYDSRNNMELVLDWLGHHLNIDHSSNNNNNNVHMAFVPCSIVRLQSPSERKVNPSTSNSSSNADSNALTSKSYWKYRVTLGDLVGGGKLDYRIFVESSFSPVQPHERISFHCFNNKFVNFNEARCFRLHLPPSLIPECIPADSVHSEVVVEDTSQRISASSDDLMDLNSLNYVEDLDNGWLYSRLIVVVHLAWENPLCNGLILQRLIIERQLLFVSGDNKCVGQTIWIPIMEKKSWKNGFVDKIDIFDSFFNTSTLFRSNQPIKPLTVVANYKFTTIDTNGEKSYPSEVSVDMSRFEIIWNKQVFRDLTSIDSISSSIDLADILKGDSSEEKTNDMIIDHWIKSLSTTSPFQIS